MEVLQHFSHVHPLVFNDERSHERGKEIHCCACGELVSGPRFSCMECGFHLDRNCAEAPVEMDHPFHRRHSLNLLTSSPYVGGNPICDFCNNICDKFVYHCSCNLDFHIKCAVLSFKILEKILREPQPLVHHDPPISSEFRPRELENVECFACRKPLLDSGYISPDSGFFLHTKCLELPLEVNHLSHRRHSLFLQFNSDSLPCRICQQIQYQGLVYSCSVCVFVVHIECVSPPTVIEDPSSHEHPFTRCLRESHFFCDACGRLGSCVSYVCFICSLIIHKECISLPRYILSIFHEHPVSHKYFVLDNECTRQDCWFCHTEVNMSCGSYSCSKCKFVIHVNCALKDARCFCKIDSQKEFEDAMLEVSTTDPSFFVIKTIEVGGNVMNTEIKHFSHPHNLILSDGVIKDQSYCDGCSQLVTTASYGCSDCEFRLHASCAMLPKKKKVSGRFHQHPFELIPYCIFICAACNTCCSGFAYKCKVHLCNEAICVRCTTLPSSLASRAHTHPLLLYHNYLGEYCNACGGIRGANLFARAYRCKACYFTLHADCAIFYPETAWHKFDRHGLVLAYHEDNDYSEYHYCDICEGERSPYTWFYHCAICDNSAHLSCAFGDFPFIKRGIRISFVEIDHPHTLVFVQKVYHYPECCRCGQRCFDLAVECSDAGCKYILHWRCSRLYMFLFNIDTFGSQPSSTEVVAHDDHS
ncbi:hypothetical protein GQ457_09G029300 [Hibiscus cannabinus]